MEAGVKVAVTPFGRPLTDKARGKLNPFAIAVVNLTVTEAPGARLTLAAPGVRVKVGAKIVTLMT